MGDNCTLHQIPILRNLNNELDGPFALVNFLPAGCLIFPSHPTSIVGCEKTHRNQWHSWPGRDIIHALLPPEDDRLLRSVDFLILHNFIAATCQISSDRKLYIRVYLIPFDLPNVEGRLRRRDEVTVLKPARNYLRTLLFRLTRDLATWNGDSRPGGRLSFYSEPDENRTLAEIYNTLPSPIVHSNSAHGLIQRIMRSDTRIFSMRSVLHNYQRQSVAAMLERELLPGTMPDPLYIPIHGVEQEMPPWYMQPSTMEILRDRPSVERTRGGILCEELGTGKTVMTLALVLCTIDQLPAPEEAILDPRPVLTPLALRHLPSQAFKDARTRLAQGRGKRSRKAEQERVKMPSLVELMIHYCSTHPESLNLREHETTLDALALLRPLERTIPFYLHYEDEPLEVFRTVRKKKAAPGPKRMFLTNATLIVVPQNLDDQWVNEINKHCNDSVTGRVYRATNKPLPPAEDLASLFDIILITHPRLSDEAKDAALDNQHSWRTCSCPHISTTVRVPDCHCGGKIKDVSPLLQIRWKRLVIDEGHVAGTTTTSLMTFIKKLSIERKWIVTGTPTVNLMGLHFGEDSEIQISDSIEYDRLLPTHLRLRRKERDYDIDDEDDTPTAEALDISPFGGLEYPDNIDPTQSEPSPRATPSNNAQDTLSHSYIESCLSPRNTRVWTQEDRENLVKIGRMISSFLEVPAFAADTKVFHNHVITPLMCSSGPYPGAVEMLTQVMESVMIRHRIEDVEKEIVLPPMSQETVLLDLDPYALKTYNVIQAAIVINAVDSERKDQDYFFHPRSATYLQQLTENISQTMFWHVDDHRLGIDEIKGRSADHLARAAEKVVQGKIPVADLLLLQQALKHVESAANDPVWRGLMIHPYVCHRVYHMPDDVYEAWSVLPARVMETSDTQDGKLYHLMIPDRLKTLRKMTICQPFAFIPRIIDWGHAISEEDEARLQINISRAYANKGLKRHKEQRNDVSPAAKVDHTARLLAAQDRLKSLTTGDVDRTQDRPHLPKLLASSPLAHVRIGNSTSTKLNYILNEIQMYQSKEKFLIFSRSPLTLLYVAEALSLLGVQYKMTSRKPIAIFKQDVVTFESSDTYRVFLMELKHGARGLNLITASRVIFCEPVWQCDVESQAIKRVHRIGQTLPVTVKTLAIRGTAEEVMVGRRDALKRGLGNNGGKLPNFTNDGTMREFIANPIFLPEPPAPALKLDFPLLPQYDGTPSTPTGLTIRIPPHSPPFKRTRAIISAQSDDDEPMAAYVGSPPPSKKSRSGPTVRFADLP